MRTVGVKKRAGAAEHALFFFHPAGLYVFHFVAHGMVNHPVRAQRVTTTNLVPIIKEWMMRAGMC